MLKTFSFSINVMWCLSLDIFFLPTYPYEILASILNLSSNNSSKKDSLHKNCAFNKVIKNYFRIKTSKLGVFILI
jgi:hypothetical protein